MHRAQLSSLFLAAIVAAVLLAAMVLPLALAALSPAFVSRTYSDHYLPFELMGFSGSLAVIGVAALFLRRARPVTLEQALPVLAASLVAFHFLGLVAEYSNRSWDYRCYEDAARAILQGANPYGRGYLYPPLTAQWLADAHQAVSAALGLLPGRFRQGESATWYLVFYVYQWLQWLLVVLAYLLCHVFALRAGVPARAALALVPALFLFNQPLLRTLRHVQVNLWILDLALGAVLLLRRSPLASGLMVALGGHLKLYPLTLLGPWLVGRKWRALAGAGCGAAGILFLQTGGFRDWTLWRQFLDSSGAFPAAVFYRDNSLRGLIASTCRLVAGPGPDVEAVSRLLLIAATLVVAAGFAVRYVGREREFRESAGGVVAPREREDALWFGHSMDAIAFTLIASPVVWEHIYVLALPIVVWAIATRGRAHPVGVGLGALLMLVIPTFDVFPFSYHRLAGLVCVLWATSPGHAGPAAVRPPEFADRAAV